MRRSISTRPDRAAGQGQNRVVLSGDVVITQGDLTLRAARTTVAYSDAGSLQIQRLDATGGVVVTRGNEAARGSAAVYDFNRRVIVMSGNVYAAPRRRHAERRTAGDRSQNRAFERRRPRRHQQQRPVGPGERDLHRPQELSFSEAVRSRHRRSSHRRRPGASHTPAPGCRRRRSRVPGRTVRRIAAQAHRAARKRSAIERDCDLVLPLPARRTLIFARTRYSPAAQARAPATARAG